MQVLDRKTALSKILFPCVAACFIIVSSFYVYNIFRWRNYPDLGFGFRTATGSEVVGMVTQHGRESGMQVGDRIMKINGKPCKTMEEMRSAVNWAVGESNTYLVQRGGQRLQVTITNTPLGFNQSFGRSGFLYLLGLCYILIGILVFGMKPHRRASWIFFLVLATFGLFVTFLNKIGKMSPVWLETVHIFVYTFAPAAFIHLALSFPEERNLLKKFPYIQVFPYLLSAFLFLCILRVTPTVTGTPRAWLLVMAAYMVGGLLVFLGSCLQLWIFSPSEIVKLRSRMILLGAAISSSVPLLDFVSSALFRVYILPNFNYYLPFFVVFPLFLGYSIVKHDLFEIEDVIKRAHGYILTTGAIAGTYALFTLLSNVLFGRLEISRSPLFPLAFVLGVVFLFNPVRSQAQKLIDTIFYRLEYDYQETIERVSERMRSLLRLDEIVMSIMGTALGAMSIESGSLLLLNREKLVYECFRFSGEIPPVPRSDVTGLSREAEGGYEPDPLTGDRFQVTEGKDPVYAPETAKLEPLSELMLSADDPFIEKLAERKKEVTVYDIQEDPLYEPDREACKETLERLGATLIVPLVFEEHLIGLICLGGKRSGKFYRREDINLLRTLANQGSVAIENALLLEEVIEKERMEEELAIARDLQMSMLPAACPEIEGFEIAALSIPAREVGGDFYDFIEIGEGRVGLVIGDVTGKSVSGALVMSAARSVFRMLSGEELTVGEIMLRANRRTKQDIKRGMFVALLFAVMDGKSRSLSLCSAGQTQPIHLSSETGEAGLVKTEGDTFPLGILDEADYQETRLELAPGDRVVFYTDGIVEAMNERGEMFGFERLINVIRASGSLTADSLLKEIADRVNAFAGGAPQNDDLTAIVLSVS